MELKLVRRKKGSWEGNRSPDIDKSRFLLETRARMSPSPKKNSWANWKGNIRAAVIENEPPFKLLSTVTAFSRALTLQKFFSFYSKMKKGLDGKSEMCSMTSRLQFNFSFDDFFSRHVT